MAAHAAREYGGHYTAERITNLRNNCEKYDWAKKLRVDAIKSAAPWLALSDDQLWRMVPGQDLPRCIDVTLDRSKPGGAKRVGCLVCGDKIFAHGNYPYDPDFKDKPWKLTCPSCGAVFPTNDFGKYYQSGIDDRGLFNPAKADRSLLFNTEHPDPKDPLHLFGVDDGYGFADANGKPHRFIGYYTWKYWRNLISGLSSLSNAYLYTGEVKYAHKAAILLDRIADVYPSMDWKPYARKGWFHSDGGRIAGKIEGAIWETQTATNFADAYDKIISGTIKDDSLYAFLTDRTAKFKLPSKGTRDQLVKNIDDNVLRCSYDGVLSNEISGNEGMQQRVIVTAALALNTQPETSQWLDWLFEPDGGAIPGLMLSHLDRDGTSDEGAPGYAMIWGQLISNLGLMLADYPAYTHHDIFEEYPQFRSTYLCSYRLAALGIAIPNYGDSGSTGAISSAPMNAGFIAEGFRRTRDPALAIAAYHANGNSSSGLGRDIYSADPDALAKEIESIGKSAGPRVFNSELMSGYGVALLQSGDPKTGAAVPINFGRTSHHAHLDQLNFDLLALGHWLMPDQGYPEYATSWPSRDEWTVNTIAHNTVVVDQRSQGRNVWGGHTKLFKQLPGLSVVTLSSPQAYPSVQRYERTMILVDAPSQNHYLVDLFRVDGGKDHLYSIHGPPGAIDDDGLKLIAQKDGSYAGESVAPEAHSDQVRLGYSYLFNVRRDAAPPAAFQLDWKAEAGYRGITAKDDIHVRLHAMTQCDDVALADGKPPQNKVGNPKSLGYALLHRKGENLSSQFASVIESYRAQPFIRSVKRESQSADRTTIRIELADGSIDVVTIDDAAGGITFTRQKGDQFEKAISINGQKSDVGEIHLAASPAIAGHVVKMNRELAGGGWIVVDRELPTDASLVGQYIMIDNKNERDACYKISSVEKVDGGTRISCGPISFIRGFDGPTMQVRNQIVAKDYQGGFLYDFEPGATFHIPSHAVWSK
jgi:hypothetical protein